jgi:hypothetical protein
MNVNNNGTTNENGLFVKWADMMGNVCDDLFEEEDGWTDISRCDGQRNGSKEKLKKGV